MWPKPIRNTSAANRSVSMRPLRSAPRRRRISVSCRCCMSWTTTTLSREQRAAVAARRQTDTGDWVLPPGIIVVSYPAACSGWAHRLGGCYWCSGREEQAPSLATEQSEGAAAAAAESPQAPPSNYTIYIHLHIHILYIIYIYKLG